MNPLEDFLQNHKPYNAAAIAQALTSITKSHEYLTGKIDLKIVGVDYTKSLQDVTTYCIENPQPVEVLEKVVDLMVSSWIRAKFIDYVDKVKGISPEEIEQVTTT